MSHLKTTLAVLFAILATIALHGQEIMLATGGNTTGPGGTVSYSVGQLVYNSNEGTNGSVDQGIQQPYEIWTSLGFETSEIDLELSTYPNPTYNVLTLNINNYKNQKYTYALHNLKGELLEKKQVLNGKATIVMKDLPVSTYLLIVLDNNTLIKTFKIVKN